MIKNIFFDFDGVIVDSVNIKTEAFKQIYCIYGKEVANKVVKHHINNGGMSRYEKFKFYHSMYLGKILSQEDLNKLVKQFSKIVVNAVIKAPEVKGANDFLKKYYKTYNMFVISATPYNEINYICKKRSLSAYFKEVCGSPNSKTYWSNYLLKKYNFKKEETIFVGDALADYKAAQNTGIQFYLKKDKYNVELFENIPSIKYFVNFTEFERLLRI